jgi:hypothetical protein
MDSFPTAKISPSVTLLREICPVCPVKRSVGKLCVAVVAYPQLRPEISLWGVTQCRRFGTTYRLHLQGSSNLLGLLEP